MNSEKMIYNFRIELGGFLQDTQGYEPTTDDILYFLNKSQENFVTNNFSGINDTRRGFEQSQRLIDELKTIYKKDVGINTVYAGVPLNGFHIDKAILPNDMMFMISSRSNCFYSKSLDVFDTPTIGQQREIAVGKESASFIVDNNFSQSDDIYSLLHDPFNTTKKTSPLVDVNENFINVYTDENFFVNKVFINYLKKPQEIIFLGSGNNNNQDCELPDFVHENIVEDAVNLLLQSLSKLRTNNSN